MAGSGKTTLLQRLNSYLHTTKTPGYIINLDPAVTQVPYGANIDIRDTVRSYLTFAQCQHICYMHHLLYQLALMSCCCFLCDSSLFLVQVNYKNVMKQYGLGPNGGILTSLNLFATRFDQVLYPAYLYAMQSFQQQAPLLGIKSFCILHAALAVVLQQYHVH